MRSLRNKLLGLAVSFLLPIAFPSLVQAQSQASCEILNRDQTGLDQNGAHPETACDASETCPSGMCSTRRLNFPRKLTVVWGVANRSPGDGETA